MSVHPTKVMQDNAQEGTERKKLQQLSVMYGSHFAMRRVLDAKILAQVQRPSGHRSSYFGLRHHLGNYENFGVADYLNDPYECPDEDKEGQRMRMEKALGMY